jgi:hypothetical protein
MMALASVTRLPHQFDELAAGDLGAAPASILPLLGKVPWDVSELAGTVAFAVRSLELPALSIPPNTVIVVDGDLAVAGLLDDRPLCADVRNVRGLVVSGALRVGSLFLGSEAHIGGSLTCEQWLLAESDGDFTLRVGGDLRAKRAIALGHHVEVAGTTHAECKLGLLGLPSDLPKSRIASAFVPDLVNQWGGIDIAAVAERIVQGKSVLLRDA